MCTMSYKIKSELIQHEMTHSDHYNYSCETCGKQFRGKVNLCGHRFARLQHLRNHLTTHSSVGTFPCDICGAKSKTMDAISQHKKSHRDLGLLPDQPPAQVDRSVQDQRNLASKGDNQRSPVAHFGMEQKPIQDQKPFMMGDHKRMAWLVGLEGYKDGPLEEYRMVESQHRLNSPVSEWFEQLRRLLSKLGGVEGQGSSGAGLELRGLTIRGRACSRMIQPLAQVATSLVTIPMLQMVTRKSLLLLGSWDPSQL